MILESIKTYLKTENNKNTGKLIIKMLLCSASGQQVMNKKRTWIFVRLLESLPRQI